MDSLSFEFNSLCRHCKAHNWHTWREHTLSIVADSPFEDVLSHEPKHPTDAVAYDITKPFSTDKA
jgi:hypothetical protein